MTTFFNILSKVFFEKTPKEPEPTMMMVNGKLMSVFMIGDYYYTKDSYGKISPLMDERNRHVRKGLL